MRRPRGDVRNRAAGDGPATVNANVITVRVGGRTHYAHPESGRTLCGKHRGVDATGFAQCVRCEQILAHVDTRLVYR